MLEGGLRVHDTRVRARFDMGADGSAQGVVHLRLVHDPGQPRHHHDIAPSQRRSGCGGGWQATVPSVKAIRLVGRVGCSPRQQKLHSSCLAGGIGSPEYESVATLLCGSHVRHERAEFPLLRGLGNTMQKPRRTCQEEGKVGGAVHGQMHRPCHSRGQRGQQPGIVPRKALTDVNITTYINGHNGVGKSRGGERCARRLEVEDEPPVPRGEDAHRCRLGDHVVAELSDGGGGIESICLTHGMRGALDLDDNAGEVPG